VDRVVHEIKKGRGPFRVYGPLVHNPQVLMALEERGVCTVGDPWELSDGTLFLRTHGVTREERARLQDLPLVLRDLTCPKVGRALAIAGARAAEGCDVIILGDSGHQEVKAVLSCTGGRGTVIGGPGDVDALPDLKRPFLISQTTQNTENYRLTLESLRRRWPECGSENTICGSTESRQSELRMLMEKADCVVVVGGARSANTARLAAIARESGLPVFQVESEDQIPEREVAGYRRVLVTAGASTPGWSIRKVRARLLEIHGAARVAGLLPSLLRNLVYIGVQVPLAAVFIGLAQREVLGGGGWLTASLCAGLLLWSFTGISAVLGSRNLEITSQERQEYMKRHSRFLFPVYAAAALGAVALSLRMGGWWIPSVAGAVVLFAMYCVPLLRRPFVPTGFWNVPGSREVLFTLGWGFFLAMLPAATISHDRLGISILPWPVSLMALFFARSLFVDLVDLQGDALLGMDTLPLKLGGKRCRTLLLLCLSLAVLIHPAGWLMGILPPCSLGFVAGPLVLAAGLVFMERDLFFPEMGVRTAADGSLLAAGLLPLLLCRAGLS
jgi:4-hydroxy-3-methylbut-2-enyl diphosphate reductase